MGQTPHPHPAERIPWPLIRCKRCDELCVPYPHATSPTCSWCWYQTKGLTLPEEGSISANG